MYVDDAFLPRKTEAGCFEEQEGRTSINEIVKPGQSIVVQVTKEAIGTKGARVTRRITFPGRYLVLMPTVNYIGVSRRIGDDEERDRLRKIARKSNLLIWG